MAAWLKIAARSFGVALVAAAAQLGAAQALTLLVWTTVPTEVVWRRQLMWLLFIFAAAVLAGVAGGRRSVRAVRQAIANRRADAAAARNSGLVLHQSGIKAARQRAMASARFRTVDTARGFAAGATRVSAILLASLGALAGFALVWLPARGSYAPADLKVLFVASVCGIAVGAVLSLLALLAAPIAANAAIGVGGVWIFGVASAGVALATGHSVTTPRLGVLDAPDLIDPDEWWFGPYLMVAVAAVFAGAIAAGARWIGAHRLGIALSGLAGPAIVAAAYLMVGPHDELMSGYVASLLAATAGLFTSAVTAAAQNRSAAPGATRSGTAIAAAAAPVIAPSPARALSAQQAPPVPTPSAPAAITPAAAAAPYWSPAMPAPTYTAPSYPTPAPSYPTTAPVERYPAAAPVVEGVMVPPKPAPPKPAPRKPAPAKPASPKSVPPPAPATHSAPTPVPVPVPVPPPPTMPPPGGPTGRASATAETPAPPAPAPARGGKTKAKGRADQTVRVPEPAQPARRRPAAGDDLPRTARPAEVVAVQSTRLPTDGPPDLPRGRRARRRAEKEAAERAELERREAEQRARDARTMGKREREHIAWVQRLVTMPGDPTLENPSDES